MVGLDAAILMHPEGVGRPAGTCRQNFSDPLVECRECHQRYREDQIPSPRPSAPTVAVELHRPPPVQSDVQAAFMGPVEDSAHQSSTCGPKPPRASSSTSPTSSTPPAASSPSAIAQIGKAFRNEITPGNFTFRTREFEQMEIEFFVKPGTDDQWLQQWVDDRFSRLVRLSHGIRPENLRLRESRRSDELWPHYAKDTYDIEYRFPWGWGELEGIANRTDFDLKHATPSPARPGHDIFRRLRRKGPPSTLLSLRHRALRRA